MALTAMDTTTNRQHEGGHPTCGDQLACITTPGNPSKATTDVALRLDINGDDIMLWKHAHTMVAASASGAGVVEAASGPAARCMNGDTSVSTAGTAAGSGGRKRARGQSRGGVNQVMSADHSSLSDGDDEVQRDRVKATRKRQCVPSVVDAGSRGASSRARRPARKTSNRRQQPHNTCEGCASEGAQPCV